MTDGSWFCYVVEDDAGELNKMYVLRRLHRQGIGRLLTVANSTVRSAGATCRVSLQGAVP